MGNPINHGTKNDLNIIVDLTYDKAGRRTSLRDPRGNLTEYDYDLLNRRVELTNPLSKTWTTAYTDLGGGGSRTTLTDPNGINTQRDFDRAGRVQSIQFGNPANTPDVQFAYDEAGNRERMSEFSGSGFTSKVRETTFTYDDLRRVTAVDFDTDGNGSVEESVAYEYDAAGLKTKMTLPGSLEITYDYDANGRLIGMTDWDAQTSEFGYDLSGRHIVTRQDNGLRSRYSYDADGRLITLRHTAGERTLGHFAYHYDKRGNRIRALEALPHPATTSDTTIAYNDDEVEYRGTWTNSAPYKQTTVFGASLKLAFFGTDATVTVGTGVNHTRFDIYINRQLWQTVDGYAASNGTLAIPIALENEGPHLLEIRNRPQHSQAAKQDGGYDPAIYKLQFKQLLVPDMAYDLHTIEYVYDALSRVEDVAYYAGRNLTASPFRSHAYTYDRLGNRLSASLNGGGATNYTYNAANQLTSNGTNSYTYDNNGNLTNDGVNTHTWDRANRLTSVGSHSYTYDGLGNRVQKTVSGTATSYLLDLNANLVQVLAQTTGANTDRVLHGPRGVQAFEDSSGDWSFMLQDALGSVRLQVDDTLAIAGMRNFAPYGDPFGEQGSVAGDYGFTGEQTDANDLLFLRARYYNPNMATFMALDPQEGSWNNPLTLNAYGYVGGNPINRIDPTGMVWGNAANLMKPDGGGKSKGVVTAKITNKTTTQKIQKDVFSTVKPNVVATGPKTVNNVVKVQPIVKLPDSVNFNSSKGTFNYIKPPRLSKPPKKSNDPCGCEEEYYSTHPPTDATFQRMLDCMENCEAQSESQDTIANQLIDFDPNRFPERSLSACTNSYSPSNQTVADCWAHVSVLSLIDTLQSRNIPFTHHALIEALIGGEYGYGTASVVAWGNEAVARQFYSDCGSDGCQGQELYDFLDYFQSPRLDRLDDDYNYVLSIRDQAVLPNSYWISQDNRLLTSVDTILNPTDPSWLNGVQQGRPYGYATRGYNSPVNVSDEEVSRYRNACGFAERTVSNEATPPMGQMFIGTTPETDPALGAEGICTFRN